MEERIINLIRSIENEYGHVSDCPDDDQRLQQVQDYFNASVKAPASPQDLATIRDKINDYGPNLAPVAKYLQMSERRAREALTLFRDDVDVNDLPIIEEMIDDEIQQGHTKYLFITPEEAQAIKQKRKRKGVKQADLSMGSRVIRHMEYGGRVKRQTYHRYMDKLEEVSEWRQGSTFSNA